MAKADINLDINTKYNGDGIKKLNNAIRNSSGNINKVSGIVQNVSTSLGDLEGKTGAAAAGFGRLVGAATSMGVVGVVIAGIITGVRKLMEIFEAADKKIEEMSKRTSEALKNGLVKAVKDAANAADFLQRKFSTKGMKYDSNMASVVNQGVVSRMEHQKEEAVRGKDPVEAAKTELEWVKKIEAEKTKMAQDGLRQAQADFDAQKKVMSELEKRVSEKQLELKVTRETNKAVADGFAKSGNKSAYALNEMNKGANKETVLKKEIEELMKQLKQTDERRKDAALTLQKAFQDSLTQQSAQNQAVLSAQQKIKDEEEKAKEKELAERKKQYEDALKRRKEMISAASKELGKMTGNLQKALKKSGDDAKKAVAEKAQVEKEALDLRKKQAEEEAELFRQRAIEAGARGEGLPTNNNPVEFNEWKRNKEDAERQKKKMDEKQTGAVDRAKKERDHIGERIFDRHGRLKMGASEADKKRYRELSEYINLNDPKKLKAMQDKAKRIEEEKLDLARKTKEALEDIDKKMKNLGL